MTFNSTGVSAGSAPTVALTANTNLNVTNTTNISDVITGTANFTKSGSGTLSLIGANTYVGTTSVTGGVLKLGTGGTLGSTSNALSVSGGGTVDLNSTNQTVSTLSLGTGGSTIMNSVGSHTLTTGGVSVSGTGNTIAANTTVSGAVTFSGTSALTVTGSASGTIAVSNNATLAGTGSTGLVTLSSGGAINLTDAVIGTLTVNGLTTSGGGTLTFDISGGGTTTVDKIANSGTLTISGVTTVNIGNLGGTTQSLTNATNTYALLTNLGSATTANFNLATTLLDSKGLSLSVSGGTLYLNVGASTTNGAYTLTTTAASLNVHANGGTTTLSTTFANSGTSPQDSLNYSALTATGTGVGTAGGTTSGGPIAPGGSGTGSASNTFTATTAGSVAISNSAAVTNATASGTPGATNVGPTINVYSGLSTWTGGGTSGAWGTLTGTGSEVFGQNWDAGGSPGVTAGFTGVDKATFAAVTGNPANYTVNLNSAAPNLNAITFNAPSTSYNIAQGTGSNSITLSGTSPKITVTAGKQTISTPVVLGVTTELAVASGQQLTLAGQVSGSGTGLSNTGAGTTILTSPNTYTGGTTISAGKFYVNGGVAGASSGTGSGAVSVTGGTLAGSGTIKPTGNVGVTIGSGATLASGSDQTLNAITKGGNGSVNATGTGGGLTLDNTEGSGNLLSISGGATLKFDLGSTVANAGSGARNYGSPNMNSTYLNITGSTIDQIFANTTTSDNISLVDLTSGAAPGTVTLTLRYQNPYLLIETALGNNNDFANLWTTGGEGVNGYVLGVSDGSQFGYTGFNITMQNIDGGNLVTSTNYQNLRLYLYNGNLEVVPEPQTWAMIVAGLALLVYYQNFRFRRGFSLKGRKES